MRFRFVLVFAILTSLVLSACGQKEIKNPLNWPVEDFTATTQDNKSIGLEDLKGKIWVSDFIFTSCADVCPPMTSNMAKLQQMVKDEGLENVEFVSFSVDPTVDTPEVLTRYADLFKADYTNWTFLTGYSQEFIETFAKENFKTWVVKPKEGDQVVHQTYFYLVGPDGQIKKNYGGYKEVPFEEIISHIKALQ